MQLQAQKEEAMANREDIQQNEKDNIVLKGDTEIRVNAAKEKYGMIRDQNEIDNKPELME
jgi:hypothetical protein